MINMRHKPLHLPQVSAPYNIVVDKLKDEGIECEFDKIAPFELDNVDVAQGIVFSDEIGGDYEMDDDNPIYMSDDGVTRKLCDGHHRYMKGLFDNISVPTVIIKTNHNDACRFLNKIQDIYEFEESKNGEDLEEVESQDAINFYSDDESQFLNELGDSKSEANEQIIMAYRSEPISVKSVVGNFFSLNPSLGDIRYEIKFDNLLDTSDLGVTFFDGQIPIEILSNLWFPNTNFQAIEEKTGISILNLKMKAVTENAKVLGYDGIKYGDKLLQGFK